MRYGFLCVALSVCAFVLLGTTASAESEFCPASLTGLVAASTPATFDYYLLALSPRTVDTTVVAETDHGWYTWKSNNVPLQTAAVRIPLLGGQSGGLVFAASPLLSVTFPQAVQIRHAWVSTAKSTGDSIYGWDAAGTVSCDPDFSSPFPTNAQAQNLSHPRDQVPATPPPAVVAESTTPAFSSSACDRPFAAAESKNAPPPDYPQLDAPFKGDAVAVLRVAIDAEGKFTDAWVVESTGIKPFDDAALVAARRATYRPQVAYCKNVDGYYYYSAEFKSLE